MGELEKLKDTYKIPEEAASSTRQRGKNSFYSRISSPSYFEPTPSLSLSMTLGSSWTNTTNSLTELRPI